MIRFLAILALMLVTFDVYGESVTTQVLQKEDQGNDGIGNRDEAKGKAALDLSNAA